MELLLSTHLDDNELGQDFYHRGGQPGLVRHRMDNHGHLSVTAPAKVQLHDHLISARSSTLVNFHATHLWCTVSQVKPSATVDIHHSLGCALVDRAGLTPCHECQLCILCFPPNRANLQPSCIPQSHSAVLCLCKRVKQCSACNRACMQDLTAGITCLYTKMKVDS